MLIPVPQASYRLLEEHNLIDKDVIITNDKMLKRAIDRVGIHLLLDEEDGYYYYVKEYELLEKSDYYDWKYYYFYCKPVNVMENVFVLFSIYRYLMKKSWVSE